MKNRRRFGLGSGPSGCPKARSRRFDAGVGPVELPEKTVWATAVRDSLGGGASLALASVILALGAGPSGFPDGRSFRDSHGKPAPSHARAPLFWRWGLAHRASRNNFPGKASATAMANPRRRSRTLRYFGAGGLLPETNFRATQSCICGPKPMSQHGPRLSRVRARPVAVLSTRSGQMARSLASGLEAAKWPDLLDPGCGWPISYCHV